MIQRGIEPDVVTNNALMDGYYLQCKTDEVVKVFDTIVHKGCVPNVCRYNTLKNGYCKTRRIDKVKYLFGSYPTP